MSPNDEKTLYAAMRLIKSQMRKYVWERKANDPSCAYPTMVSLEETIEKEARAEWDAALAEWDLTDPEQNLRVQALSGEAFFRSVKDMLETFEGAAPVLKKYVETYKVADLLEARRAGG